jgi:hypothetical protein
MNTKRVMSRKTGAWFAIGFVSLCFCAGCASTGTSRTLAQYDPTAIVMVASNQTIHWIGEEIGPGFFDNLFKKKNETDTNVSSADELINRAEAIVQGRLTEAGVINLAPKDQITGSGAYATARIDTQQRKKNITADGYQFMYLRDKAFHENIAREIGVQSTMYITFAFTKKLASGFSKSGTVRACVAMDVALVTAADKIVYHKTFEAESDHSIRVSYGYYNHDALMELFDPTITNVCYQFTSEFAAIH